MACDGVMNVEFVSGGVTVGHRMVMPQDTGVGRVRRLQTRKIKEDEGSQELENAPMGCRV